MTANEGFILSLSLLMAGMVYWAFKRLPDERWQFLASVPVMKDASGRWHGLNFTYYGLLTANAVVFGVTILIILFGALGIPTTVTLGLIVAVLMVCLPAARWVAQLVEGKQCTFTIAGAFFVGIFIAPAVMGVLNTLLPRAGLPAVPIMPGAGGADGRLRIRRRPRAAGLHQLRLLLRGVASRRRAIAAAHFSKAPFCFLGADEKDFLRQRHGGP